MLHRTSAFLLCVISTGIGSSNAAAASYALDPSHTSLVFSVSHLGYSYTYGRFNTIKGAFVFDKQSPDKSAFQVAIDVASIDSNDEKRDEHLKSPDFFDARQFPTITFQTAGVTATPEGMQLMGNLTMHGVTKQVTLPLKYLGEGKGPYGKYRCGFSTQFAIKRSDFGMKGMIPHIGDEITVSFSFEGIQNQ